MIGISYYGNIGSYRTRTFSDIFPDVGTFVQFYNQCGIPKMLKTSEEYENWSINTIYVLLMAEFANSHIKSSAENQFKLRVMVTIFEYGETWQRDMYLQKKLLDMSDVEILEGSKAVYNRALNPENTPSTNALEELTYINEQNTTNYRKNRPDAFNEIRNSLKPSTTKYFIDKFRPLFVSVAYPDKPLIYSVMED